MWECSVHAYCMQLLALGSPCMDGPLWRSLQSCTHIHCPEYRFMMHSVEAGVRFLASSIREEEEEEEEPHRGPRMHGCENVDMLQLKRRSPPLDLMVQLGVEGNWPALQRILKVGTAESRH